MSETAVTSFIIRFTQEPQAAADWRGLIRHVQSSDEAHFTRMADALAFMANYVEIGDWGAETGQSPRPKLQTLPSRPEAE